MFLMIGINEKREDLEYVQQMTCEICGRYGYFNVFMACTVLYLFFIPVFRWNRHYYVETSCCRSIYELDQSIGARIARKEDVRITDEDLSLLYSGKEDKGDHYRKCRYCGYETREDFEYCPKCGERFEEQ